MSYVTRRRLGEQPLWRRAKPLLGRLDIELTERCDNDCVHCCICLPEQRLAVLPQRLLAELAAGDVAHCAASASMTGTMAPLLSKRIS